MDRRQFLITSSLALSGSLLGESQNTFSKDHLADTALLSAREVEKMRPHMLKGMNQYFEQALKSSPQNRKAYWNRNHSSLADYRKSIALNRNQFKKITGVVDERKSVKELYLMKTTTQKALVAETGTYSIYSVRWPVLEDVSGVGLWIEPRTDVKAQVVALPEASWTPEMLAGLSAGVP